MERKINSETTHTLAICEYTLNGLYCLNLTYLLVEHTITSQLKAVTESKLVYTFKYRNLKTQQTVSVKIHGQLTSTEMIR
jgi:aspartokinase-like uncharacterized kinase